MIKEKKILKLIQTKLWEDLGREEDIEVKLTDRLEDLGLDSLDRIELLTEIEEKFNKNFTENDYKNVETVEDVIKLLK